MHMNISRYLSDIPWIFFYLWIFQSIKGNKPMYKSRVSWFFKEEINYLYNKLDYYF